MAEAPSTNRSVVPTSLPPETTVVGKPIDRVDGRLKTTGGAKYAADHPVQNLAHAVAVISTIAKGTIKEIQTAAAEKQPGVLAILTHENAPKMNPVARGSGGQQGQSLIPLQGSEIHYGGQYVALVIAETIEQAKHAASLVTVEYDAGKPTVDTNNPTEIKDKGKLGRGDPDTAMGSAAVKIEQTYQTPVEHHNPMESHATTAAWEGDRLTLWDSTQHVLGVRGVVAGTIGIEPNNVRVISPFMGGGFGTKGSVWPNSYLAAIAAKQVGRPVKMVVTRQQMFSNTGYRPRTLQKVALGADAEGKLVAITHDAICQSAEFEDWVESSARTTNTLYACPNVRTTQKTARINAGVPVQMRAPGEASGLFALESAMDELAIALKIDPIELRLRNYAEEDWMSGKPLPFTSKSLRQCYQAGAEKFGWSKRNPEPRSMRDGNELIGWGMASALYPAGQGSSSAAVRLQSDGTVIVTAAAHDLGTGMYTIAAQIAAETLGVPADRVRVQLGDTVLPRAPGAGGSTQAVTVGSAVRAASEELVRNLADISAGDKDSPLSGREVATIIARDGRLVLKDDPSVGEPLPAVVARNGNRPVTAQASTAPDAAARGKNSRFSFGAQFAEVRVDPLLGRVRLSRYVGAYAAGRILNPKTARSQMIGAVIMGLGMALFEHTVYDPVRGKIVTDNLADYIVPVNADVPEIDIVFVDERDDLVNPLGAKGVGELGITGVPAAIANAVYHATGKRVRDLPITPDKVMDA